MFKEVEIIVGKDLLDLKHQLNDFLVDIDADTDIKYDFDKFIAVVETKKYSASNVCISCKYWDDDGNRYALIGECHKRQTRRKFNDKSCSCYEGSAEV